MELNQNYNLEGFNFNQEAANQVQIQSIMSAGSGKYSSVGHTSIIHPNDAHIRAALEINPRYVDKNIHETLDRLK